MKQSSRHEYFSHLHHMSNNLFNKKKVVSTTQSNGLRVEFLFHRELATTIIIIDRLDKYNRADYKNIEYYIYFLVGGVRIGERR
jgi:hypothetical protein